MPVACRLAAAAHLLLLFRCHAHPHADLAAATADVLQYTSERGTAPELTRTTLQVVVSGTAVTRDRDTPIHGILARVLSELKSQPAREDTETQAIRGAMLVRDKSKERTAIYERYARLAATRKIAVGRRDWGGTGGRS